MPVVYIFLQILYNLQENQTSNSNSIFIVLNLHLKTDSRGTKPKKQRTIIMSMGHSKGRRHGEKPEKGEIRVDILVQRDRF